MMSENFTSTLSRVAKINHTEFVQLIFPELTPNEAITACLAAKGLSSKEIAAFRVGISANGIKQSLDCCKIALGLECNKDLYELYNDRESEYLSKSLYSAIEHLELIIVRQNQLLSELEKS